MYETVKLKTCEKCIAQGKCIESSISIIINRFQQYRLWKRVRMPKANIAYEICYGPCKSMAKNGLTL